MTDLKVREDVSVYPLLTTLTDCLCGELADSGLAAECQCLLVPGVGPSLDFCMEGCDGGCPGQAWVRMVRAFPSANFPSQDSQATCVSLLAFDIEIGVARCLPNGDAQGQPPTDQDVFNTARLQLADMAAMRRAIICCFAGGDVDHLLGNFETSFAGGGCLVSAWTMTVREAF